MSDPKAPHGRDENGKPLAPFGWNTDGTPRKSNRGRRTTPGPAPKMKSSAKPGLTSTSNLSDGDRKQILSELAMTYLVTPLATVSQAPIAKAKLGRHADALAGDAFILAQVLPGIFDGAILLSKTKPRLLAWMDKMEEAAPWLVFAQAAVQGVKMIAENHLKPSATMAHAGRNMARMHMEAMAAAINEQADAMRAQAEAQAARFQAPEPEWAPVDEVPTVQFAAA